MTRRAGYDANGDELYDTDVLSEEELEEDRARVARREGGRHSFRVPAMAQRRVDEYGYDQDGRYYPELDGGLR